MSLALKAIRAWHLFFEGQRLDDPAGAFPRALFDKNLLTCHLGDDRKLNFVRLETRSAENFGGITLFMYASAKTLSEPLV